MKHHSRSLHTCRMWHTHAPVLHQLLMMIRTSLHIYSCWRHVIFAASIAVGDVLFLLLVCIAQATQRKMRASECREEAWKVCRLATIQCCKRSWICGHTSTQVRLQYKSPSLWSARMWCLGRLACGTWLWLIATIMSKALSRERCGKGCLLYMSVWWCTLGPPHALTCRTVCHLVPMFLKYFSHCLLKHMHSFQLLLGHCWDFGLHVRRLCTGRQPSLQSRHSTRLCQSMHSWECVSEMQSI